MVFGAIQVVGVEAALFVGAEDERELGVGGMVPDGGVVGGVAFVGDGGGLGAGDGADDGADILLGGQENRGGEGAAGGEDEDQE